MPNTFLKQSEIPFGYLIYCLSQSFITDLSKIFVENKIPLTVEQYRALFVIAKYPGQNQQWLADAMLSDKSSSSRHIKHLEGKSLVSKNAQKGDGNQYTIFATDEGNRLVAECYIIAVDMVNSMLKGIPDNEKELLQSSILKILKNLNRDIAL